MQNRTRIIPNSAEIARARVLQGLTKVDLGNKASVPHSSIVRVEQGFVVSPKTATKISEALGKPFDNLFTIKAPGDTSGVGQAPASGKVEAV